MAGKKCAQMKGFAFFILLPHHFPTLRIHSGKPSSTASHAHSSTTALITSFLPSTPLRVPFFPLIDSEVRPHMPSMGKSCYHLLLYTTQYGWSSGIEVGCAARFDCKGLTCFLFLRSLVRRDVRYLIQQCCLYVDF